MTKNLFGSCMDRKRIDGLETEVARLALDMLKTYENEENQIHQAFLYAGHSIYSKQYWSFHAYNDFILAETERLLRLARNNDGAWSPEPGRVEHEIAAASGKLSASVEEIQTEIIALSTRFEDMGYKPIEIGRALATVGLTFAPIGFIEMKNWVRKNDLEGRAERDRAFLDEHLGKDRYPVRKETRSH